ncbi:alpha/beta hydrolase-fold protein [Roseomonas sp. 18066]|uniref:alpha/beta hydrolase-fold protein n=1 Tax=Roseomonas sp. 18066 TaxID=2681412 RepID=UPI00135B7B85|nr:alpha/beta hydrolase-fold protein [Roseomonas sp. 18066]
MGARGGLQPGLQSFGGYELDFVPAEGEAEGQLVIAATGLHAAGAPITVFDYRNSLMARPGLDRVFLRDQKQSWYNAEEGWDALVAALRGLVAAGGYRQVTILGVSMGGYGALLLAATLPEARVLALSPSFTTDSAPFGRGIIRYPQWFDDGHPAPRPRAELTGDPARLLCLFGDRDVWDVVNARAFFDAGWPQVFFCADGSHELGVYLKQAGRFARVMDRLLQGAPMTAVAAAAGAYLAFSHCQAFALLAARRALYAGELEAADRFLHYARQAPTTPAPRSLALLGQLRDGLAPPTRDAAQAFLADPGAAVPLPAGDGWEATLSSPEARAIGASVQAGPLALLRIRPAAPLAGEAAEIGKLRLRLRFAVPPAASAGSGAISAYAAEPGARPRLLARAEDPAQPLGVDVPFRDGEALLLLQRPCFYSMFDAGAGALRTPWSMRLFKLTLKPLPLPKAA